MHSSKMCGEILLPVRSRISLSIIRSDISTKSDISFCFSSEDVKDEVLSDASPTPTEWTKLHSQSCMNRQTRGEALLHLDLGPVSYVTENNLSLRRH